MVNLLPLEKIKAASQEYQARRLVVSGVLILATILISLIMVGSFYWSATIRYQADLKSESRPAPSGSDRFYQQLRLETKKLIDSLKQSNREVRSATAVLDPILAIPRLGIKINSIHFSQAGGDALPKTTLAVIAVTRKNAADFIATLRQLPGVAEVTHPILIDNRNLNLPLEIIWQTKIKNT